MGDRARRGQGTGVADMNRCKLFTQRMDGWLGYSGAATEVTNKDRGGGRNGRE